jgi:hypothetical protein
MAAGAGMTEVQGHFIKTFEANSIYLVQQRYSKFRSRVTEKTPGPTDKHSFRTVAKRAGALNDRANVGLNAGKRPATVFEDTIYGERGVQATSRNTADSFSKPDLNRMLEDTSSILYTQMTAQMARKFDSVIEAAFYAQVTDAAGGTYDFGVSGTNPTVGDGAAGISLPLVLQLLEAFNLDDVDPDEEKFLAVTPKAVTALLQEQKYTSTDYANAHALMAGKLVESWCGFTWVMSNLLTGPQAGQKYHPAWTRDAMGLLVLEDVTFESGKSPMNNFDTIVQLRADFGAVRIQDEKVKRLFVAEA